MPRTIRAITLDLDDTLWPVAPVIDRAERLLHEWLEREAPAMAQAFPRDRFMRFRRKVAAERPEIAHDFTALRGTALALALEMHGCDPKLSGPAMEVFLAARQEVELYPDALPGLARLAARFPLVALTNGNADVARVGLESYFVAAFSARSVGAPKPEPKIFHAACAHLGLEPSVVLHVGDDQELDVGGAHRAGLRAAWINRGGHARAGDEPAGEFADLDALCAWLGV
jgi:2-haloalkanoic acid dehalogenase type II